MVLSTVAITVVLAAGQAAQVNREPALPDLSGKWQLIGDKSEPGGTSAFGEAFTASQSRLFLTVEWTAKVPGGRGMPAGQVVQRPIESRYRFDGTKTNVSEIWFGSSKSEMFSTAAWTDGRLVVMSLWKSSMGLTTRSRQPVVSIGPDDILVVETTPYNMERPGDPVRNYYRRVPR